MGGSVPERDASVRLRRCPAAPPPLVYLGLFHLTAALWGVRSAYWWAASPFDLLANVAAGAGLAGWAFGDARRRGRPVPVLAKQWLLIVAGPFAAWRALAARGRRGAWRGFLWAAGNAALGFALVVAGSIAGGSVASFVLRP